MIKRLLGVLVTALFFVVPTAQANPEVLDDETQLFDEIDDSEFEYVSCWRYDGRPRLCGNTYGCAYNFRTQRCRERGGFNMSFTCYARDRGYEEHWRGHMGQGRNMQQARQRALFQCQREHRNCYITSCTRG